MKVNLGVELNDEQRVALASIIAGKSVKRMASRDDVRDFLGGIVGALACAHADVEAPTALPTAAVAVARVSAGAYTPEEQTVVDRLLSEGRNAEYARGWISAGRVIAKSRARAA
jgi:hypothetical protein